MSFAVFLPTLHSGFLALDDSKYVQENTPILNGLSREGFRAAFGLINREYWLPVLQLSYMADVEAFGTGPEGFHTTNLLLHSANSALLLLVLYTATGALWPSLLAAALFSLHPMRVEPVAWITARKDLLSGFFFLIATLSYIRRARGGGRWWLGLSTGALLLGLMAKPVLVTFPLLMLVADFWPLGRFRGAAGSWRSWWENNRTLVYEKAPFLVLSAAFSILTLATQRPYILQHTGARFVALDSAMRAMIAPFRYLYQTVLPLSLGLRFEGIENAFWEVLGLGVLAAAAHLVILVALVRLRGRHPSLLAGWLWFLAALLPTSGIVPVGGQWLSDRFVYIPHMGLFAGLAFLAVAVPGTARPRRAAVVLSLCAVVALLAAARIQTAYWRDSVSAMKRSVTLTPGNPVAWRVLGDALDSAGAGTTETVAAYRKALTLFPSYADAHNNLGGVLVRMRRTGEGTAHILEALKINQDNVDAHNNLGVVLLDEGKVPEAIGHFEAALRIDPGHALAHNNMGNALMDSGKTAEAMRQFEDAVRLRPGLAEARNSLGAALYRQGRTVEAIGHLWLAVRIRPDYAEAHNNLGLALAAASRMPEAAQEFALSLRNDPANSRTRNNLGNALMASGRVPEAVASFTEALRIDPAYAEAHNNLGLALSLLGDVSGATRQFETALRLAPENPKVHANLGDARYAAGRADEAAVQYGAALALGYETADLRNNLGVALLRTGRFSEAATQFERAFQMDPNDVGILLNLAGALRDSGNPREAAEQFERALALSPGNPDAISNLERLKKGSR